MKKSTLLLIFGSFIIFNCTNASHDDLHDHEEENPDPTANVTYVDDIKSIIDSRCTSCHGTTPTNGAPPGSSFTTYTQVKNNVVKIINRINGTPSIMPPTGNSPLTQTQIDLIEKWKDDGLLEN